jgi:hypothetical protein
MIISWHLFFFSHSIAALGICCNYILLVIYFKCYAHHVVYVSCLEDQRLWMKEAAFQIKSTSRHIPTCASRL